MLKSSRSRNCDLASRRYVQSDPIGLAGGLNTYTYVKGNPLRFSNPRGLDLPGQGWNTLASGGPSVLSEFNKCFLKWTALPLAGCQISRAGVGATVDAISGLAPIGILASQCTSGICNFVRPSCFEQCSQPSPVPPQTPPPFYPPPGPGAVGDGNVTDLTY